MPLTGCSTPVICSESEALPLRSLSQHLSRHNHTPNTQLLCENNQFSIEHNIMKTCFAFINENGMRKKISLSNGPSSF